MITFESNLWLSATHACWEYRFCCASCGATSSWLLGTDGEQRTRRMAEHHAAMDHSDTIVAETEAA